MKAFIRAVSVVLGLGFALPSHATFHLWRTDQIYSNADGSVQYIVLVALSSGQEFIAGHNIAVSQNGVTHTYNFTTNLPGDTASGGGGGIYGGGDTMFKSLLLATQGFANLNIVKPDYIIPDGFLFTSNGSINWGGGWDIFNYGTIPMDGTSALFRAGNVAFNAPQNFLGQTGSIQAVSAPFNVQGLWWRASESGWGVNITHQSNTLFATWFTYDTDGSGMWLVLPNGAQSTSNQNSYSGDLFRTTGPSFDVATWDSTKVVATKVGTASFTFTDKDTGTFSYTVNGTSQSKPIVREVFASSVPTCAEAGSPSTSNYQDLWWHSPANSESGWGINITQQGSVIFATWFTYDTTGKGQWIVMAQGVQGSGSAGNSWTGDLFKTTATGASFSAFDPTKVVATKVGTGTFTFSDASNGTFTYTVNGTAGSKAITRESFATPASVCN